MRPACCYSHSCWCLGKDAGHAPGDGDRIRRPALSLELLVRIVAALVLLKGGWPDQKACQGLEVEGLGLMVDLHVKEVTQESGVPAERLTYTPGSMTSSLSCT